MNLYLETLGTGAMMVLMACVAGAVTYCVIRTINDIVRMPRGPVRGILIGILLSIPLWAILIALGRLAAHALGVGR